MHDLIAFLRARLDEAETAAKRVSQPYRLYVDEKGRLAEPLRVHDPYSEHDGEYQQWPDGDDRMPNHITTWTLAYDPALVLADIEAKRRIIAMYESLASTAPAVSCDEVARTIVESGEVIARGALRWLVSPFATHPDYDENWRP